MKTSNVREQATQWLVVLQTTTDLDRYWPDFEAWLAANPKHREAYAAVERRWADLDMLRRWLPHDERLTPEAMILAMAEESRRRRTKIGISILSFACLLGAVATSMVILHDEGSETQPWTVYDRGADHVALRDGSTVQLKDNTHLRVRMTESARQISLDSGEAYFDVKPQIGRPFDVDVGSVVVRAIGTAFTVRRDGDGSLEIAVRNGKVDLERIAASRETHPWEVGANEIARVSPSGHISVEAMDSSDIEHKLAWTKKAIPAEPTAAPPGRLDTDAVGTELPPDPSIPLNEIH